MVPPRPDAGRAHAIARDWFLAGRRIDMRDLAAEVGVSRATLFRWVGNRDQLLGEILWSLAEPVFDRRYQARAETGADLVAATVGEFAATVNADEAFRGFLRTEPERALRVLTTKAGGVQQRTIRKLAEVIDEQVSLGKLTPPLPVPDLAYLVVRIAESFIYTDIITGGQPDAGKAREAVAALLR
ncbi:QsdR family transcriptional regulator [Amycolatopsis palatopharyngis]|uniref:QsdR family transcriptional regulator n=1 Tax=Amycolatopsis palatopharyngis TaxID=187982 RepID=UPI000E2534F9|nr:QsdR family transcriptional regulator [Amycolatopsis palatopharyngis]